MMADKKFLTLIKNGIVENWNSPALSDHKGVTYSYKEFAQKIAELHILFESLEIQKGDKIAVCGRNSAHWAISFFASITYGAVVTTILHDFNSESIQNIADHSEAKVLFVNDFIWEKVDATKIPKVETAIQMDDFSILKTSSIKLKEVHGEWQKHFDEKYPNGFSKEDVVFHDEQPEELAVLNYTSGTTSSPKGVMLPYRSLWSNTRFAIDMIPFVKQGDGIVCMLPMAHMYGLAFEVLLSIAKGCHINYLTRIPSPNIILEAFSRVNPTLILCVPLIIEKIIRTKVFPELEKSPTKTMLKVPFLRNKVYSKVSEKLMPIFGNRLVEIVIGGAALNKEVGDFLTKIKFPYTVGYGMTECGPLITYDYWDTYRAGSCGKPVDRMKVWIDSVNPEKEKGEIIVHGDNIMLGYYKNPEATAAVLTYDGHLRTGDIGTMDKDGYVYIRGRSKTMILGPSGQNIYPEEIESILSDSPYISESLIIEESGKLIALIYPDKEFMEKNNIEEKNYSSIFVDEIKKANKRLASYSQIANFRIQQQEFEKTPKRSIKRFLYQK